MRWTLNPPNGSTRAKMFAAALCAVAVATAACGCADPAQARPARLSPAAVRPVPPARTHRPSPADSVLAEGAPGSPGAVTAMFARRLFTSAPVVVVASGSAAIVKQAGRAARAAHAPLLAVPAGVSARLVAPLAAAIRALHARTVLAVSAPTDGLAGVLAARLPGVRVTTRAGALPGTGSPAPLRGVAVVVHRTDSGSAVAAITATAQVAGAAVVPVSGNDPRADPAAIKALARVRPREVVAIGSGFGPARRLAARVAVAATGIQLPGGGQVVFPRRRLVALYGHPGVPSLGVLGGQDLPASIALARQLARAYRPLSKVPVIPAFEIIATVAQASPGPDGDYSYETPVSALRPWVRQATAAGMYVILDLQPGRASLLAQAEHYRSLLAKPDVGLALDAEWKLQPGQLPLQQIGSVSIGEVNSVVRWLAALTARDRLPQKVLVLHQFRLSMIQDEKALDTSHDDLSIIVHMDGQGTPQDKQQTWDAVTRAAPRGVRFGWKNFFVKDHPMLTPRETMAKTPTPVMISYQ
jgi:hypothetical protein